jgi:peptide/nickel transport system substrate-binding protein
MPKPTRRQTLAGFTTIASAAAWMPRAQATPRDALVIGKAIDDTITLDPGECYELTGIEICTNVYDRILRYEADDLGRMVGGVADSWTVGSDGKTYTFRIRPGQRFMSGNPVTAGDCAWSLQRVVLMGKTSAFLLTQFGWTGDNVAQMVRAASADTLVLHVPAGLAPTLVLNMMTSIVASVVDRREALARERDGDFGNAWLKTNSASSGAYRLVAWRPSESITLEANPQFRLGAPKLRQVILRHVPEPASQRLLLEKGDIDVARGLAPEQMTPVHGHRDLRIESFPGANSLYAIMNQRHRAFADMRVRRAVKMLVDYEAMTAGFLKGRFFVHQTFLPMGFFGAIPYKPFKLDVAGARKLLAEAGYPNGFEVRLTANAVAPFPQIAQAMQATLALGGIKVTIAAGNARQVFDEIRGRSFQMALISWAPDFFDPHSNADFFVQGEDIGDQPKARTGAWRASWLIPELTAAMRKAAREPDGRRREQMYIDLQRRVTDEGPYVWMFQNRWVVAMRENLRSYPHGLFEDQFIYRGITKT